MARLRVVLLQIRPGSFPSREERRSLADLAPGLIVLPEYWAVAPGTTSPARSFVHFDRSLEELRSLAVECNTVVVGGTVVEKEGQDYFNSCFVFDRRQLAGFYRKIHVTERERAAGMTPGRDHRVLQVGPIRIGLLICADVLVPASFDAMRAERAHIIAVPTSSPYRPDDTLDAKERRDREIFVAGAARASAFVVKTCAAGALLGAPLQGRSLVAGPAGVLARVPFGDEDREARMVVDLDLDAVTATDGHLASHGV
ncbi:MAG: carbon-nitrogen hydrolase family protein [Acidobacteriota bacterium]